MTWLWRLLTILIVAALGLALYVVAGRALASYSETARLSSELGAVRAMLGDLDREVRDVDERLRVTASGGVDADALQAADLARLRADVRRLRDTSTAAQRRTARAVELLSTIEAPSSPTWLVEAARKDLARDWPPIPARDGAQ